MATHNRVNLLQRTLPTVLHQDFPADEYEIIVVADGCTDGTVQYLRSLQPRCRLIVVEQPGRGQVAAQAAALRRAAGDSVLLLDDDLICDSALVRRHAASHEAEPSVVIGAVSMADDSRPGLATEYFKQANATYFARMANQGGPLWPYDAAVFPNCSVSRMALLEVGGFDESFSVGGISHDDSDLGLRLWSAGLQFRYEPRAEAREVHLKGVDEFIRERAGWGRIEVFLCRKHPNIRKYSVLAASAHWTSWKRWTRTAAICLPFSLDPLLGLLLRPLQRMHRQRLLNRSGLRLLTLRSGLTYFRAAAQAAGGWTALNREFGAVLEKTAE
jgi:cellulose synthase/poly-beta-1,6-N-acetylglucosamine synthase-like glycosyltransferase